MRKELKDYVKTIPDFPEPGIMFRDITSILADADGLKLAIDEMEKALKDVDFDVIAGMESRGFIFGMPIAYNLHKPFILIRKKGKLPRKVASVKYDLEYGSAEMEIHLDDIQKGSKVLIIDDLIATGGTMAATVKLVESVGGIVTGILVLMELEGLKGKDKLKDYNFMSILKYGGK